MTRLRPRASQFCRLGSRPAAPQFCISGRTRVSPSRFQLRRDHFAPGGWIGPNQVQQSPCDGGGFALAAFPGTNQRGGHPQHSSEQTRNQNQVEHPPWRTRNPKSEGRMSKIPARRWSKREAQWAAKASRRTIIHHRIDPLHPVGRAIHRPAGRRYFTWPARPRGKAAVRPVLGTISARCRKDARNAGASRRWWIN